MHMHMHGEERWTRRIEKCGYIKRRINSDKSCVDAPNARTSQIKQWCDVPMKKKRIGWL